MYRSSTLHSRSAVAVIAGSIALSIGFLGGLLGGCRQDPTSDIRLAISGDCPEAQLQAVTDLSVNVYGIGDGGELCILGKRCISGFSLTSVEQIADILSQETQPLVDVELEEPTFIEIIGHRQNCLSSTDHEMCGRGDLAGVENGSNELAISLTCGNCDNTERLFCP